MKVSIIICSHTGNTLKLGDMVSSKLMEAGHEVNLVHLASDPPLTQHGPGPTHKYKITNMPDVSSSDLVIIGGPVWAFRPYPLLLKAMADLSSRIRGKRLLPFITHSFPYAWMTGSPALNKIRRLAADAGAKALPGVVLSSAAKHRIESYAAAADSICAQVS